MRIKRRNEISYILFRQMRDDKMLVSDGRDWISNRRERGILFIYQCRTFLHNLIGWNVFYLFYITRREDFGCQINDGDTGTIKFIASWERDRWKNFEKAQDIIHRWWWWSVKIRLWLEADGVNERRSVKERYLLLREIILGFASEWNFLMWWMRLNPL